MKLAEVPVHELEALLRTDGLALDFGIVRVRVRSRIPALAPAIGRVYGEFSCTPAHGFFDVTASLDPVPGLRGHFRPQIHFVLDGEPPFEPFPADTHLPLLEWGLNWSIARRFNHLLLLHAGVVERNGAAIVLPALPGSGKSTLTAALACRGFRLLSDEFGAVNGATGELLPVLKPVALKNESIDVIRRFAPAAVIGPSFPNTRKGTVAHMAPNAMSVHKRAIPAQARLVVFPRYVAGSPTTLEATLRSRAFARLSINAFNYEICGPDGFDAVAALIDGCRCYELHYSDLDDAIRVLSNALDDTWNSDASRGRAVDSHAVDSHIVTERKPLSA